MLTSLSVRIAELPRDKTRLSLPLEALLDAAAEAGFDGVSVRPSAIGVDSSDEERRAFKDALDRRGLRASMVTGSLPLATNDADAPAVLRNITPHLDLAEALGARLVRVMLHDDDDIAAAGRACDEARERGMRLLQQCHWGSLAETVEASAALVRAVGRENFGLTFEPANLAACGSAYDRAAFVQLAPYLGNVYYQNVVLDDASPVRFATRVRGSVGVRFAPLDDAAGLDVDAFVDGLRAVAYDGWFTVHQPLLPGQDMAQAIAAAATLIRSHRLHEPAQE